MARGIYCVVYVVVKVCACLRLLFIAEGGEGVRRGMYENDFVMTIEEFTLG